MGARLWDGSNWVEILVPSNMATLDTAQTISGLKDFTTSPTINSKVVPVGDISGMFIQRGTFTITFAAGVATGNVTFPTAFSGVPVVVMYAQAITNNTSVTINSTGVTASVASWRAQQQATGTTYAGSVGGYWIAVGQV